MTATLKSTYDVLLADDSEDDRHFMRLILRGNPRLRIVGEVRDGEDAVSYLAGIGNFADRDAFPFPDIVFLDLKMPRRNGFEVLEWLQTQDFKNLVVIVVSGSVLPQDAARSLALGAAAYKDKATFLSCFDAELQELNQILENRQPGNFSSV